MPEKICWRSGGLAQGLAAAGVVDGFPLHLFYQSGQRDGDVSKHKEREGKDVEELFPCGDLDLIPLAQDGEDPIEEQAQVEAGHSGQQETAGYGEDLPYNIGGLSPAGQAHHQVEGDGDQGEQHPGGHGHKHIVAGPAFPAGLLAEAADQVAAVIGIDLIEALGPAQPLIPGLPEGGGLLIIDDCLVAVADAAALQGTADRKLDVLGEQVIGPAAVLPDHIGGDEEAGARNVAVAAQQHPGEVEEAGLPQEPDGITGGDPVGAEVPGVAVAGDSSVVPAVKHLVHLRHKVGVHQVVGVKDQIAVILVPALVGQGAE